MSAARILQLAWRESSSHPLRSVLLVIGVALGIASVTTLVFAGEVAKSFVANQVERATGKPDVALLHITTDTGSKATVGPDEIEMIGAWARAQGAPATPVLTAEQLTVQNPGSGELLAPAVGVDHDLPDLRRVDLVAGRFFDATEGRTAAPVVVIPRPLADRLGGPASALGRHLALGPAGTWGQTHMGAGVEVVGVFDPPLAEDGSAYVPTPLAQAFGAATQQPLDVRFLVGGHDGASGAQVASALRADHAAWTRATSSLEVTRPVLESEAAPSSGDILARVVSAIQIFLALVAAVSLCVGAIGLANVTIMAVGERTREIGIRRACGATATDIRLLVLTETVVLTVAGGLVGTWVAIALTEAMAGALIVLTKDASAAPALPLGIVAFSVAIAAMVGVISGWVPARRASRLPVVDALRVQ